MYVYSTAIRHVSQTRARETRQSTVERPTDRASLFSHTAKPGSSIIRMDVPFSFLRTQKTPWDTHAPHRRALDDRSTNGDDDARDGEARVISFLSRAQRSTRASATRRATPELAGRPLARRPRRGSPHLARAPVAAHRGGDDGCDLGRGDVDDASVGGDTAGPRVARASARTRAGARRARGRGRRRRGRLDDAHVLGVRHRASLEREASTTTTTLG